MKSKVFEHILSVDIPVELVISPDTGKNLAFRLSMRADGNMPFAQFIVRRDGRQLAIVRAKPTGRRDPA